MKYGNQISISAMSGATRWLHRQGVSLPWSQLSERRQRSLARLLLCDGTIASAGHSPRGSVYQWGDGSRIEVPWHLESSPDGGKLRRLGGPSIFVRVLGGVK